MPKRDENTAWLQLRITPQMHLDIQEAAEEAGFPSVQSWGMEIMRRAVYTKGAPLVLELELEPKLKKAAIKAAKDDGRSLANYVVQLIRRDMRQQQQPKGR